MINDLLQYLSIFNTILFICGAIGGSVFVFRHARKVAIISMQKETIEALQQRMETFEAEIEDLKKENQRQCYIIETMQEALKQRGIIVSISGDLVTIQDANGSHTLARGNRPRRPAQQQQKKREGDA